MKRRLKVGDEARLQLDAAPDYMLPAHVTFVAAEAQFTPKYVETATERDKLVYRVKLAVPRALAQQHAGFKADFSSAAPLEKLGLSAREAEILLWVAQGKSNYETGVILNISPATVKKHLENIYGKLGVESRNAATLKALEILASSASVSL